jgi:hypothetical protein
MRYYFGGSRLPHPAHIHKNVAVDHRYPLKVLVGIVAATGRQIPDVSLTLDGWAAKAS